MNSVVYDMVTKGEDGQETQSNWEFVIDEDSSSVSVYEIKFMTAGYFMTYSIEVQEGYPPQCNVSANTLHYDGKIAQLQVFKFITALEQDGRFRKDRNKLRLKVIKKMKELTEDLEVIEITSTLADAKDEK